MKKVVCSVLICLTFLSIIFIHSAASAQEINVYIDGRKIFFDVPPTKVNDHTLVPLRAIFEGLGALVEYNNATSTITATKDNIRVVLTLNSTRAYVNNQARVLEVPAMTISGRTMVPLRFVGEAFGANVKWDEASHSIFIDNQGTTAYSTPTPGPVSNQPAIYSVTHNANTSVGPGSVITVTLIGSSGGNASFDISGVVNGVPMMEKGTGVYEGSYTVKMNDSAVNAPVIGHLITGSLMAPPVQAGSPVNISQTRPSQEAIIYSVTHNGDVLKAGDVLIVDLIGTSGGKASFDIGDAVTGIPMNEIKTGVYEGSYTVRTGDNGNDLPVIGKLIKDNSMAPSVQADKRVTIGAENIVIYSVSHNGSQQLHPGDALVVTLKGTSGGMACFDIGDFIRSIPMQEINSGVYQGTYTLRSTDNIVNGIIYGHLTRGSSSAPVFSASMPINFGSSQAGGEIQIKSFTHNATAPLRVGDELRVILVGVPGGVASFDITNFKAGFPMNESQPGVYKGTYRVTAGDNVTDAIVLGHLSKGGYVAPVVQAGTPITISGTSPTIAEVSPADGAVVETDRPNIYVTFDTQKGTIVNPQTVRLMVDGADVSSMTTKASSFVTYYPANPLPIRRNIWVELTAQDNNGNQVFYRWSFRIIPGKRSLISSAFHNAQFPLLSGQKLQVTMFGSTGAQGWFEIAGFKNYIPMTEVEAGKYYGEYMVNSSDNVAGEKLIVHLKTQLQEDSVSVDPPVTFDVQQGFSAPSITNVQDGQTVTFPLVIKGYTKPFATVEIKYEYRASLFGSPIMLQGVAGTSRISADQSGYFSDTYNSSFGSGTQHRITVTSIDNSGKNSPSTVINVKEK